MKVNLSRSLKLIRSFTIREPKTTHKERAGAPSLKVKLDAYFPQFHLNG